jgi:NitT/TauT family transport system substrate-binding protein
MKQRSFTRRMTVTCSALVVGAVALAGCGGSSSGGGGGSSSVSSGGSGGSSAALPSLTLGSPGIPPVISGLLPYIADKQGFYKKFGVNVTIKSFQTGTDATRAVSTGQIDAAIMPPAQLMELTAQGHPLVAMQGQEVPDWTVVSTDPSVNSCTALKGQTIGVDAIGGIRDIALSQMLHTCNLSTDDVHEQAFPGNSNPQALIAGQLKVSVLHLNEVVDVQSQLKKSLTVAVKESQAVPDTMYEMYGTTTKNLAAKRSAFVKLVAAQIATIKWMNDPANADAVAQYGTVVGDSKAVMLNAMSQYRKLGFWSSDSAGLPAKNINNTLQTQIAVGNVKAAQAPKVSQIVDLSIYKDALALQ